MADTAMGHVSPFSPDRLFTPSRSGKALQSTARKNILNVYSNLRKENPNMTITKVVQRTAEITGVSTATVYRIRTKAKAGLPPSTPGKKRPAGAGDKRKRLNRYDEFTLACVRRKVHAYFRRNELPTVKKLLLDLNEDTEVFPTKVSHSTLYRLLKDLGFAFKKRSRNSALIEREDLILWRRQYLRKIRQFRKEGKPVYYLDETWANAGHTRSKVWQDTTLKSAHQARTAKLTAGLKGPTGKGSRLILTHAGSVDGFVTDACDIFIGRKSTADYHHEMDGNHFEIWFETKLLPNIKPKSVIVMDNAPYHSVKVEKTPTTAWRKAEIQDWLTSKDILWETDMLKAELLEKASAVKERYNAYRIDTMASASGHTVLRLPPYHCELNPIELIWSQVKGFIARENKDFSMKETRKLLDEGISKVTTANWKSAVDHVIKEENALWELDGLIEDMQENQQFIINLQSDSDSDSSHFDDCEDQLSGIEELQFD